MLLKQSEVEFENPRDNTVLNTISQRHAGTKDVFSELAIALETEGNSSAGNAADSELVERLETQLLFASQEMVSAASQLAEGSRQDITDAEDKARWVVVAFLVVMVAIIGGILFLINKRMLKPITQLQMATAIIGQGNLDYRTGITSRDEIGALSLAFDQMTENLEVSRDDLGKEVTVRRRAEEGLRTLNEELEQRVADRTADLEASNSELEAFSYSVSHDLRAPLRSLSGFSLALSEDYSGKLDQQGEDYLRRISTASERMGRLIDDLLTLSRLSRSLIAAELVDLSAIAGSITKQLRDEQPQRRVEFVIAQGLVVHGDRRLLGVLLKNLIDNAWKYTGQHSKARIEFGTTVADGERAYFVADDGAGFDMAYYDKLFGPFQRLHSQAEFEGTGIGLATVKRIVHRHGGTLWAEGKVEEGATFYFTLP